MITNHTVMRNMRVYHQETIITNFCNTDTVLSSYEIIEILMTFANTSIAKALYSKRKGIYREQYKKQVMPKSREERMQAYESINKKLEKYDETARRFLCEEYTTRGEYTTHLPDTQENIYVHATSPIRRIVDTVNISLMNSCIGCVMLPEWHDFLYKIENNILVFVLLFDLILFYYYTKIF